MAESSGEAKVYLRLVIDEEKNKVVLAEAGKDFVDVLFSFLTLPMGTIARLFKKHNNKAHPPVSVGCFNNLYTSVVDIGVDNFQTEACKRMLLCPRSVSDVQCQRLKVNINPTEREKYFNCPLFSRCRLCSNFSTTRCQCGNMMKEEIRESQLKVEDSKQHGVFVSGGDSTTFIITDDLEVSVKSTGLVLERLKSLGCADVSKLGEKFVGIGPKEVLTLLQCVFSSNAPLTETFLNKGSALHGLTRSYEPLRPCMEKKDEAEPEKVSAINAVVRKQDGKILFVESGDDFVELLLSFLAVQLESVLEISGDSITFGCLANLCRSFKGFRVVEETKAAPADSKVGVLPCFYSFQVQLPGIITLEPPVYYRYMDSSGKNPYALTRDPNKITYYHNDKLVPVTLVDPKSDGNDHQTHCSGFLKKETKFTVSDDLFITPMSSCSTVCLLKKLQTNAEDVDVQEISISKAEVRMYACVVYPVI
ncbi:uncharacterized protein LOC108839358 [Raphanus sativus]|uniref:Uncharacterized protein LOC108839358 n=1 Tax=Raphanus sativus TaxID=3726 RepID=A0A9W3D963_RAPSA|nr:uncharacterized protein LOC108839358 [Raphanus sativus]